MALHRSVTIAAWLALTASLLSPAAADCTCRALGRNFELGQSACLATPNGFRLATCDEVLNNTSWRFSGSPCVSVQREPVDARPPVREKNPRRG